MATGVNVKMGVSGIAQFKQGMKESQAAVKNLDQQLKLNEQQLKTTGDAELYLQNKTKLLEEQIKKQSEVVQQSEQALAAMRKNGVAETSAAFQNMQAQMYKAATDLMNMRAQLDGVSQAGDDAASGVDEMNNQLKHIGQGVSFQNVAEGLGKITDGMEAAAKKAIDLGKKIVNATIDAGSWADDLATRAAYYEMTPEELQRAEKTARLIDTNVEAIVSAQRKLRKGIGSADKGVMGAFAALFGDGYDPRQKGWENAFWDAGEAIMKFSDAEEKEVYAQKLFGRSWSELIPLFTEGREQYEKMNESWNVVGDDNLDKLTAFDDQYQKMISEFETLKMTVLSSFAEGLTPAFEALTTLMGKFNEHLASPEGQEMLDKLAESVGSLFEQLSNVEPEQVMGTLKDLLNGITAGFNWLIENKDGVLTALKVIGGGFAAMKLAEFAANLGRITSGFRQLTGLGSNGGTPGVPGTPSAPTGTGGGIGWTATLATLGKTLLKLIPYAAGLVALLTPAKTENDDLVDENGNLTETGKWYQERQREEEERRNNPPEDTRTDYEKWRDSMIKKYNGAFSAMVALEGGTRYQALQDYWDKLRTGEGHDISNQMEVGNVFEQGVMTDANWDELLDMIDQMHELDPSMEDLPDDFFGLEDKYDPIINALNLIEQDTAAQSKKKEVTGDDIAALTSLPSETAAAVARSVGSITIVIDDRGVGALGERINRNMGNTLLSLVR